MDWDSIGSFLKHGIHHVLEGWDHLLFAAALVLALKSFWEVFKIIGIFTIAHSITVTITGLRGAPLLPPSIVEPIIAASIIFVAVENLMRKDSALSKQRLAVAFGFGLVHGMGLGGALLENLKDLPGNAVGWAIAAFCVGVEIGHLCVVAPLSGVLKVGNDMSGNRFRSAALVGGSVLIAAGGAYYLWAALAGGEG
jgi:hypothetical protein